MDKNLQFEPLYPDVLGAIAGGQRISFGDALQVAIGGLPAAMHVEADRDVGISAKTVGELRKVTAWPENLMITTPQERYSESAIRISKATHATRVTPKS